MSLLVICLKLISEFWVPEIVSTQNGFEADSHGLVAGFSFVMKRERGSTILHFHLSPAGGRGLHWLWFSGVHCDCPAEGDGGGSNFLEKTAKGKWEGSLANKAEVGITMC